MSRGNSELDRLRAGRTELENHYIDELASGHLSRRDFLRHGSMIGMSTHAAGSGSGRVRVVVQDHQHLGGGDHEHVERAGDEGRHAADRGGRPRGGDQPA